MCIAPEEFTFPRPASSLVRTDCGDAFLFSSSATKRLNGNINAVSDFQVGWDFGLLAMHSLSSVLNGLLVLQVIVYWKKTDLWSQDQAKKKSE